MGLVGTVIGILAENYHFDLKRDTPLYHLSIAQRQNDILMKKIVQDHLIWLRMYFIITIIKVAHLSITDLKQTVLSSDLDLSLSRLTARLTFHLSTGYPWGFVLNPLLYTFYTPFTATHQHNIIVKCADDIRVEGIMSTGRRWNG